MFARVHIVTDRVTDALVVPREAVQTGKTGTTVTVVDRNNVAHVRKVEVGAQDASGIQIRNGVKTGETVVTLSSDKIWNGRVPSTRST